LSNRGDEQFSQSSGETVHDALKQPGVRAMKQLMKQLVTDESGQDLIEYALVAAVIALGAIAAMNGLVNAIGNGLNTVGNSFTNNV
jgi:pilus assembly protein Flp/PilA